MDQRDQISDQVEPLTVVCARLRTGCAVGIATVVKTWGSSPVPEGGQLVVVDETTFFGSVSGGCVENEVIIQTLEVIESGQPRRLKFGVDDESAWSVGLPCGGEIEVFVERFLPDDDSELGLTLDQAVAARQEFSWCTDVETGRRIFWVEDDQRSAGNERFSKSESGQFQSGVCGVDEDGKTFRHVVQPPARLVIVGASHVSQVMVALAEATGFSAIVIDPREAYANDARFPNTTLMQAWPNEALLDVGLDELTAVVALSHVPDIDDPALQLAVASPAFYVGALGSRRNHEKRRQRLFANGMSPEQFERIHCPIGLDIGAVNPAEIALSAMAEFVLALRGRKRFSAAA